MRKQFISPLGDHITLLNVLTSYVKVAFCPHLSQVYSVQVMTSCVLHRELILIGVPVTHEGIPVRR
jgi:hypothetical protein